jgi:4-hydroxy-tetrahydrodipicolinate synthase
MSRTKVNGILVPHVTPFDHAGEPDLAALRECLQFWLKGGIAGLVPCGSNGEAPYLSREERKKIVETVVEEVDGKALVIAGTGSTSTKETILFTEDAKDVGADAALVVTPFYFKLSNREMYEHYARLLDAVDFEILLYSVPKFTGVALEPSVIAKLASEYDNVIGVKDSGGNLGTIAETMRLVQTRISVLAGTADLVLAALMHGASGAVVAVANVFPHFCSSLYEAFTRKDFEKAGELQRQVSYMNEMLVKKYNQLSTIKQAMKFKRLPAGYPRRPALPLEDEASKELEIFMKEFASKN